MLMADFTTHFKTGTKGLLKAIAWSGLLVGTLDIAAAIVQILLKGGSPIRMFQFIASGVLGDASFSGGVPSAIYGLVFHFCIAMGWTILFFLAFPRLPFLAKNRILTGAVYGIFVWLMMNHVILPLSNTPPLAFKLIPAVISLLIIIGAVGLPLSFLANRYYSGKYITGR